MEKPAELCPVIAVRRFILLPDQEVIVRLGLPFTSDGFPGESRCPIQIEGLGSGKIRHVVGIDAFQSLWLALLHIGTLLYTSKSINRAVCSRSKVIRTSVCRFMTTPATCSRHYRSDPRGTSRPPFDTFVAAHKISLKSVRPSLICCGAT
jgi:hypothetical protein